MQIHFGGREVLDYRSRKEAADAGVQTNHPQKVSIVANPLSIAPDGTHGAPVVRLTDDRVKHFSAWETIYGCILRLTQKVSPEVREYVVCPWFDALDRDFSNSNILQGQDDVDAYCKEFEATMVKELARVGVHGVDKEIQAYKDARKLALASAAEQDT